MVMTLSDAVQTLVLGPGRDFPVLTTRDLQLLFNKDRDPAFNKGLRALVKEGLLERVAKGVYLNRAARMGMKGLGEVIRRLRAGSLSYLSYESQLSEVSSISQVAWVYTIATTGNSGDYTTRYGDIEFTHTDRADSEILANTVFDDTRRLRVASPALAYDDLMRTRPAALHMVDAETHAEVLADWNMPLAQSHA